MVYLKYESLEQLRADTDDRDAFFALNLNAVERQFQADQLVAPHRPQEPK